MRKVKQVGSKLFVTSGTSKIMAYWEPVPGNGHSQLRIEVIEEGNTWDTEDAVKVARQIILGED